MVFLSSVNLWAVIVASVWSIALGMFWYSPVGFGKRWMKLSGMKKGDMHGKGMAKTHVLMIVSTLIFSYVLAVFIQYSGASSFTEGMIAGFWVWLGFVATKSLGGVLWENKSWSLWLLNAGYDLLSLLVAGGILAVWA